MSLPGLGPRWFVRKPDKKAAIVAVAVGIGLAASSERSAEAARLLWEQAVAGSIPAAPTMIFPPGHSVLSPVGPRRSSILTTGIWGHSSEGEHRLCTAATWVQFPLAPPARRDGRAADCGDLENRWRFTPSGGSNPPPSAICCFIETAKLAGSPGAAGQLARPSLRMPGACPVTLRAASIGEAAFLFPSAPAPRGEPGKSR